MLFELKISQNTKESFLFSKKAKTKQGMQRLKITVTIN